MQDLTEHLEKKITAKMEAKHFDNFGKQARYKGNGVYFIAGTNLYSTDTRELFLMFCAVRENIPIPKEERQEKEE